ncbi:hypothetical protein BH24DEI2_BH24DEI2_00330 [soil metagenome]
MKTAELTLYRCYWPAAFAYLKKCGVKNFTTKAYDLLMTLEIADDRAYEVAALLPTGAVIDIVSVDPEPMQTHDIDALLYGWRGDVVGFDKN